MTDSVADLRVPRTAARCSLWLDGMLHFTTGPDEQKAVHLRGNHQVILTTGANGWEEGLDVVVEGAADRITDPDNLTRLADAWTKKWDG